MVSSKDVARLAGVSQATVSRVLNRPESVRPATRDKVIAAIEQLGYEPNRIARSLVTSRTRTIALVIGTVRNAFFVESMDAIVQAAKKRQYHTTVFFDDADSMKDIWREIKGSLVDGILFTHVRMDDPHALEAARSSPPSLFFNRAPQGREGHYVGMDSRQAGELVVRHLVELGHRRIGVVTGELYYSTFRDRLDGYRAVLQAAGIPVDERLIVQVDTSRYEVHRSVVRLMQQPEPPTAIVCFSDTIALDCIDGLLTAGWRIPEDVSVAGIDNIRIAGHQAVQLTSAGIRKISLGELAVDMLIDLIEGEGDAEAPRRSVIQPELIVRRTTAPPRREAE